MKFEIAPKETEIEANWYDARLYCFTLNIDGKVGWRLPTLEELHKIYEIQHDFISYYYWSSTEYEVVSADAAWCHSMGIGYQCFTSKFFGSLHVRAIRDIINN